MPIFLASSSKTLINSSPIIFLLVSGSSTPASLLKNLSSASTLINLDLNLFPNTSSTSSPSFFLRSPWSTKIQVKFSPIASFNSAAATDESTPPDNAQSAFPSPIFSLSAFTVSFAKDDFFFLFFIFF